MCPGALHPGALSISNRIKDFNIIKGRGSPIWITLFLHVFAHYICPDHLKTHRITLGSLADHASDQVLCFLSKTTADHISSSHSCNSPAFVSCWARRIFSSSSYGRLYIAVTHTLSCHAGQGGFLHGLFLQELFPVS